MTQTNTRKAGLPALLLSGLALSGCTHRHPRPPAISYDDVLAKAPPAVLAPEPPKTVEIVTVPEPLPLPGQLKPMPTRARAGPETSSPMLRVRTANASARVQPAREGYLNAIQVYPFALGSLYQVYASPGQVTDIALQEGETLVGSGPVAAGDTARWIIGDTTSGTGPTRRVHILLKPTRSDLATNLVVNTDRRTYHLELRATPSTYMASVSWRYPEDELIALRRRATQAEAATPIATGIDLNAIRFRYAVQGDAPWKPVRAFDDGTHVYIEFPPGIGQGEMPPLFVVGEDGRSAELVNYRVLGHHMIVDRLFAAAELRLGGKHQERVRIFRTDGRAR